MFAREGERGWEIAKLNCGSKNVIGGAERRGVEGFMWTRGGCRDSKPAWPQSGIPGLWGGSSRNDVVSLRAITR